MDTVGTIGMDLITATLSTQITIRITTIQTMLEFVVSEMICTVVIRQEQLLVELQLRLEQEKLDQRVIITR